MRMHNPPHPGDTILEDCIKVVGWTVTEAAKALGLSRAMLSRICHGHAPVTPDVAVRLERVFPPSAEVWLALQQSHDLWPSPIGLPSLNSSNPRATSSDWCCSAEATGYMRER